VSQLLQHVASWPIQRCLADRYAESADEAFYARFSALLTDESPKQADNELVAAASFYSVASEVELRWHADRDLRGQMDRTAKDAASALQHERTAEQAMLVAQMTETLSTTANALACAHDELARARAQRDETNADLLRARTEHEELRKQMQFASEAAAHANARLVSDLGTARHLAAGVQQALDETARREALALGSATEATSTVRALQRTVSWRITAPLRLLRRYWPRRP
jgi:hypothetical protein